MTAKLRHRTPRTAYACKLPPDLHARVMALKLKGFSASGWLTTHVRPYVLHALAYQHKLPYINGAKAQLSVYLPVDIISLLAPLRAHRQGSVPIWQALSEHIDALEAEYQDKAAA